MSVAAEIVEAPAPVEAEDREGGPGVAEAKVWPSGVRRDATLDSSATGPVCHVTSRAQVELAEEAEVVASPPRENSVPVALPVATRVRTRGLHRPLSPLESVGPRSHRESDDHDPQETPQTVARTLVERRDDL